LLRLRKQVASLTRQLAGIITALLTMTGRVTMLGIARWGERGTSYRGQR